MTSRMIAVAGGLVVLLAMVATRIVQLTLADSPDLARLARRQQHERIEISAHRGAILDRHGDTLAASVERPSIFVRPRRVHDRRSVATALGVVATGQSMQ